MQWHGENGWKVTKPSFTDIEPDQFRPVAEYLSTGDFKTPAPGHTGQLLEGDELKSEAIGVLAESWSVAESLGLHDMMQVIVSKMKALRPWPQDEVMAFAKRVYSTQAIADFPVDADIEMKKLISSYIAVNYDGYVIKGPQTFLEELRSFPELRKDVHEAMAIDAAEEMNNE